VELGCSLTKRIQHKAVKFTSTILFLAAEFFNRQKMQRITSTAWRRLCRKKSYFIRAW